MSNEFLLFTVLILLPRLSYLLYEEQKAHALDLEPPNKGNESTSNTSTDIDIDHKEYNAGRIIGILERWLMCLVVVFTGNLNTIGLIIAAKGLARMKQIEQDKQFAEYVLVGTFLSTLMAVVIAYWVKSFI